MRRLILLVLAAALLAPAPASALDSRSKTFGWTRTGTSQTGTGDFSSWTEQAPYTIRTGEQPRTLKSDRTPGPVGAGFDCGFVEQFLGYALLPTVFQDGPTLNADGCWTRYYVAWAGSGTYTGVANMRLSLPAGYRWNVGANYSDSNPGYWEYRTGSEGRVIVAKQWTRIVL